MTPSTMLPANEAVLKRRFPDAYIKIMQTGNRMPSSFYYEDTTKGPKLKIIHGEYEYSPYGSKDQEKLLERWFSNLNLVPESLYSLSGFGDGSHVRYFIDNSGTGVNVMVAEKDPALLRRHSHGLIFPTYYQMTGCYLALGNPKIIFLPLSKVQH